MTANISQHVSVRRRAGHVRSTALVAGSTWRVRTLRPSRSVPRTWQRGSITPATITVALSLFALLGVSALSFFYLQQVFGTASRGSDIRALETQISELHERQRSLELQGAELRSIQSVEERVKQFNLVEIDAVAYLAPTEGHVAAAVTTP